MMLSIISHVSEGSEDIMQVLVSTTGNWVEKMIKKT